MWACLEVLGFGGFVSPDLHAKRPEASADLCWRVIGTLLSVPSRILHTPILDIEYDGDGDENGIVVDDASVMVVRMPLIIIQ